MVITNDTDSPKRADVMLALKNPQYSRAALAKLFDINAISKDDKAIKPGDKIKPGESILADLTELQKTAEVIELPIIYEDNDVIIIDKPSGIISHARGRYWDEASVASFIREKVSGSSGERAGIVHRLDRATSGVMICAKTPLALKLLQKQFSSRKVHKTYVAAVEKAPDPTEGLIDIPIARNPNKPQTFIVSPQGKPAQTEYHTIKEYDDKVLVRLHPLTGRSHQLRVHLKYLNRPIIGDTLYGGKEAPRLYLHAETLEITLPSGERKVFNAPLPKELT
jgi:23S rRNA pseudouridine1911/1915/1917 synthase